MHIGGFGEDLEVGDQTQFEQRRPGGWPVVVVGRHGQQVSCPLGSAGRPCRVFVEPGEHLEQIVAQFVRHVHQQLRDQIRVDLAERDVLEGGHVERVLGADVHAGREEDEQRRTQPVLGVRVAQLDQLGAGHGDISGDGRRLAEDMHLRLIADGLA
ncbi:hypothetical protein OHA21_00015 [Actinoplanes sp. NBC_00393]